MDEFVQSQLILAVST